MILRRKSFSEDEQDFKLEKKDEKALKRNTGVFGSKKTREMRIDAIDNGNFKPLRKRAAVTTAGIGAGSGAINGALIAGKKGAAIGAAAGTLAGAGLSYAESKLAEKEIKRLKKDNRISAKMDYEEIEREIDLDRVANGDITKEQFAKRWYR